MSKIVVINSTGPMGSTVAGSIIEKFNYLNIPLRKIGFHDYLIGNRNINDPYIWKRMKAIMDEHGRAIHSGGVSIIDVRNTPPKPLVDSRGVVHRLSLLENRVYTSVSDLYSAARIFYASRVVYKSLKFDTDKHIEYTVDIHRFNYDTLNKAYQEQFDKVYAIHLHREFPEWVESLASQRFLHPRFRTKYLFLLSSLHKQFQQYEDKIRLKEGLHLEFNSLFSPDAFDTIGRIARYIEEPIPKINWPSEKYDLYGKLCDYNSVFYKSDSPGRYLSKATRTFIGFLFRRNMINRATDILVAIMYLVDLYKFRYLKIKMYK